MTESIDEERGRYADGAPPHLMELYRKVPLGGKFRQNLHNLITRSGITASDTARNIWGEVEDGRGYMSARGRDRLSRWLRGVGVPREHMLQRLAVYFGVEPDELAPDVFHTFAAESTRVAPVQVTTLVDNPDMMHVTVDTALPTELALEIARKVLEHEKSLRTT